MRPFLATFFLVFFLAAPVHTAELQGKVVGVIDGDTISVLRDGQQVRVRLTAIDAPEKGQPYGQKAKQFVIGAVAGKTVTVIYESLDQYRLRP